MDKLLCVRYGVDPDTGIGPDGSDWFQLGEWAEPWQYGWSGGWEALGSFYLYGVDDRLWNDPDWFHVLVYMFDHGDEPGGPWQLPDIRPEPYEEYDEVTDALLRQTRPRKDSRSRRLRR